MRRKLFTICSAVSLLLLCVAVCVLWAGSYRGEGRSVQFVTGGRLHHAWINPGCVVFGGQPNIQDIDLSSTRIDIRDGPLPGTTVSTGVLNGGPLWRVSVDFPIVVFVISFPLLLWIARRVFGQMVTLRRRAAGCPACGYDVSATPDRCPECGAVPEPPHNPPQRTATASSGVVR